MGPFQEKNFNRHKNNVLIGGSEEKGACSLGKGCLTVDEVRIGAVVSFYSYMQLSCPIL